MWFNSEFYRLADELAAEVARLKERWGEYIVRRALWRTVFQPVTNIPPGAIIQSATLMVSTRDGFRVWDDADITMTADFGADVAVYAPRPTEASTP